MSNRPRVLGVPLDVLHEKYGVDIELHLFWE
jgi:hypothetical protein